MATVWVEYGNTLPSPCQHLAYTLDTKWTTQNGQHKKYKKLFKNG